MYDEMPPAAQCPWPSGESKESGELAEFLVKAMERRGRKSIDAHDDWALRITTNPKEAL